MVLSYTEGLECKYKKIFQINHSVTFRYILVNQLSATQSNFPENMGVR